jgi:CHRD domain
MKGNRSRKSRGLTLATTVLMLLTSLLALGSGLAAAQQGADIYASADLRPAGASEGPPPPGTPSGTATFAHLATGGTRVTVTAMGLPANTTHVNHIHDGSCSGSILLPLKDLQADASGNATAVTDITQQVDFTRWYVNVHEGATLPSPGIICGKVTPALAGAPPPGQPPASTPPATTPPGQPPATTPPASTPTAVGGLPGVPRTGQGDQFGALSLLIVVIVSAALLTVVGIYLRFRRPTQNS